MRAIIVLQNACASAEAFNKRNEIEQIGNCYLKSNLSLSLSDDKEEDSLS